MAAMKMLCANKIFITKSVNKVTYVREFLTERCDVLVWIAWVRLH